MKKVISFCLLLMVWACQPSPPSKAHLREIVDEQNKKLEALFKEGDVDKLVTMYCDSAKLCANEESEIYIGREAIKKFWTAAMEGSKLIEMETETLSVDGTEDLIYETGKVMNKVEYNDSIYTYHSKFVNVWKKQQDGSYKLDIDTWNSMH